MSAVIMIMFWLTILKSAGEIPAVQIIINLIPHNESAEGLIFTHEKQLP